MQRCSGLDAMFLQAETPVAPLHVLGVFLLDPSTARPRSGRFDVDELRRLLAHRIPRTPALRRRVVEVPLGLDHPVWVDDGLPDLDFHVRRVRLPAPGGRDQLAAFAADVAGDPLPRDRPLWAMWFVEGVERGRVGLVAKIHHAAVDGVAGVDVLGELVDLEPLPVPDPPPAAPAAEAPPAPAALLGEALTGVARRAAGVGSLLGRLAGSVTDAISHRRGEPGFTPALPFTGPRHDAPADLTARRAVALAELDLDDIRWVRRTFGVTVNDVVLAVVAGALRSLLADRGAPPSRPLVAVVPASVRPPREGDAAGAGAGNQVAPMFAALPVDLEHPIDRLQAVHDTARNAKALQALLGPNLLGELTDATIPALLGGAARFFAASSAAPAVANLVVSNVPGPPMPLYLAGARVEELYPLGPVFHGLALNVTVLSYQDRVEAGILACPDVFPGVDDLAARLPDAVKELLTWC